MGGPGSARPAPWKGRPHRGGRGDSRHRVAVRPSPSRGPAHPAPDTRWRRPLEAPYPPAGPEGGGRPHWLGVGAGRPGASRPQPGCKVERVRLPEAPSPRAGRPRRSGGSGGSAPGGRGRARGAACRCPRGRPPAPCTDRLSAASLARPGPADGRAPRCPPPEAPHGPVRTPVEQGRARRGQGQRQAAGLGVGRPARAALCAALIHLLNETRN